MLILTVYSYMAYIMVAKCDPLLAEVILAALIIIFHATLK
jgi:hypothetical protein